jgi:hypothetical protein
MRKTIAVEISTKRGTRRVLQTVYVEVRARNIAEFLKRIQMRHKLKARIVEG